MKHFTLFTLIVSLFALGGCATDYKPTTFQEGQVQQAMVVKFATCLDIKQVDIAGKPTGTGAAVGAAAGGTTGLYAGNRGGILTGIIGAAAGGIIGNVVEKNANSKKGIEITYQIDGSDQINELVQEQDPKNPIQKGDRLKIVMGSFSTRAEKL
jgi:outer membrane lipoprotein SlyB